jgi:hypothetical protein
VGRMRGSSVVVRGSFVDGYFFLNSMWYLGFREVDSLFDMEFDPPGAKPKGVHPVLVH